MGWVVMNTKREPTVSGWGPALEDVSARLNAMRGGNSSSSVERDLSLVKGPYWLTRRVPAQPHHFKREEFEDYLRMERFPANTLYDRVVEHVQTIRRALVGGLSVPEEVMRDEAGQEALELAEMDVCAAAEGAWKLAQQKEAVLVFETALGVHSEGGRPEESLHRLLMAAARAQLERPARSVDFGLYAWMAGGYKRVSMDGHPREVLIGMRQGKGPNRWLEFRDSGWSVASLYGDVKRMSYFEAEGIYAKAVAEGWLSLEQGRSVMGSDWRPFVTVRVCESAGSL